MKVNLDQWYKCDIDRKVYKELTKRSDWQGIKHISLWIIFLFLAGYMAFITWGTWWTVLWFLFYGYIYMYSLYPYELDPMYPGILISGILFYWWKK